MDLKWVITLLRKWAWFLILATAVAAVSSYLAVSRQPASYQSRTTLMIGRILESSNPSGIDFSISQQLTPIYAGVANTQAVRDQTMAALGLSWLPPYIARPRPDSPLIEIIVTDSDPLRAQAVANELANQLILQSPTAPRPEEQERQEFINEQLSTLQVKITETEDELLVRQLELENAVSARDIADLEGQISALQSRLDTLQSNFAALLSNTERGATNTLAVIEPAAPGRSVGPSWTMTVLTVMAVGFVLAAGAAYTLEYLDDTVRTPDDLRWATSLPTLPGLVDYGPEAEERPLIARLDPRSPIVEGFRALRTAIKSANKESPRQVLLITSARPSEGKSLTAANLSVVLAQAGHTVLLIDADLHRPIQHRIFNLPKEQGLTELLMIFHLGERINELEALLKDVLKPTHEHRLKVLTSGAVAPGAVELLSSEIIKELLSVFSRKFDFVVLDSPPVLAVTDAVSLATRADNVLLLAKAGTIRRHQIKEALGRLQEVNANVIGVALNRLNPKSDQYYHYYHEYQDSETAAQRADAAQNVRGKAHVNGDSRRPRWPRRAQADQRAK